MSQNISVVTDATFESEVLQSTLPVVVDFWAQWCGPCKMLTPILEEIAATYAGKIKVVKVNVDENQQTPSQYNVRSIPALFLFKNGEVEGMKVGLQSKAQLSVFLDEHL